MDGPEVAWDAGLGRFLLTAGHGGGGRIGVFEGPTMWGPWATVDYEDRWLGMTGGEFLGLRFPPVWMRDGGRTLWAVFSCYGPGVCGPFHDRFNLIRATLAVGDGGDGDGTGDTVAPPGRGAAPRPTTRGPGPATTVGRDHGGPAVDACRRIAGDRDWTGVAAEVRGRAADGRMVVEVRDASRRGPRPRVPLRRRGRGGALRRPGVGLGRGPPRRRCARRCCGCCRRARSTRSSSPWPRSARRDPALAEHPDRELRRIAL